MVEIAALQAALAGGEVQRVCDTCPHTSTAPTLVCPLLAAIRPHSPGSQSVICMSLSREPSRHVLLSIYLPDGANLQPHVVEILESMAAGLAMALDRTRLLARERHLLQQVERDVETQQLGLLPTLERMLTNIATGHAIEAGAVYLLHAGNGGRRLTSAACWPDPQAGPILLATALAAVPASGASSLTDPASPIPPSDAILDTVALPIASEGNTLGVLVLAGRTTGWLPDRSILGVVTGMMALLIRNSQLYAQLESQAVLEERNYLAREVHDGVAQSLGFLNFKVQHVQRLLDRGRWAAASIALEELRQGGQNAYDEVRRMIQDLRWTTGVHGGLVERLQQYAWTFAAQAGLEVSVDVGEEPDLPPEARLELFRVVQEALSNVRRHAEARRVSVRLSQEPGIVTLSVQDDGVGLQPPSHESSDHLGLRIIRERVQSIGGELQIDSEPGAGTTLRVCVPLRSQDAGRGEEQWNRSVS